jgi:hypothetical protein
MTTDLSKIRVSHLERAAFVYLRQSTPAQVEHNRESTKGGPEEKLGQAAASNINPGRTVVVPVGSSQRKYTPPTKSRRDRIRRAHPNRECHLYRTVRRSGTWALCGDLDPKVCRPHG